MTAGLFTVVMQPFVRTDHCFLYTCCGLERPHYLARRARLFFLAVHFRGLDRCLLTAYGDLALVVPVAGSEYWFNRHTSSIGA